jgi:excisionase family DNA binding protein
MTLRDVADYLLCHYATAYRLCQQRKIPGFRLGGEWRFLKSEIDWIDCEGRRSDIWKSAMPTFKKNRMGPAVRTASLPEQSRFEPAVRFASFAS